ncbi:hypothetical protein [Thermococcus nautili]|uniref:Lipoprotein n=1 Tax=Thermococcus nautili TaxID=195522 RepID=W8PIW7_9EURY|nr:hypothetical protein [Thermococcus nautili]AHL22059.1 hypothetical protein BD01_0434 [Thermococcus nautili]
MTWKIAPLLLVLVVFSAGCLVQTGSETTSPGFVLNVTYVPFKVPLNVTAVAINVSANFIGYKSLVINDVYPAILIKAGPNVKNISAFRLSKDVYLVVPSLDEDSSEKFYSLTVWLKNGSVAIANIKFSGTPAKVVDMVVNYEVEKNGTHYVVRPMSWSIGEATLWNETFNVTVELPEPIQIANAPSVEYKNGTYVLPEVCKTASGGVTVIYRYSIGDVYVVGPIGEGFVGKIYFPCEKMAGK